MLSQLLCLDAFFFFKIQFRIRLFELNKLCDTFRIRRLDRIEDKDVKKICGFYDGRHACVRVSVVTSECFEIKLGGRQGSVISS